MSDTSVATPPASEAANETPKTGATEVTTKTLDNGVILELESFDDGKFKGFKFWRAKFKTAVDAINHFTRQSKTGKSGEDIVVGILNSQIAFRMRSQANQWFVKKAKELTDNQEATVKDLSDEDISKMRNDGLIVLSEEDALTYVPQEREVDALSGLRKQKDELKKAAIKLKGEGKLELAREKIAQYMEIDKRIKDKEAEEENSLLELIK